MDFSWDLWITVGLIVLTGGLIWWALRPDSQNEEIKEEEQWEQWVERGRMAALQEEDAPLSHKERSERARRFSGNSCRDGDLDVIVPLIIADQVLNSPDVEQPPASEREELPSHSESPWAHVEYGTQNDHSSSCGGHSSSSDSDSSSGDSGGSDGGGGGGGD